MPETGFGAPASELNMTAVSYPGSVRTRFSNRMRQPHAYATYAPVLHYNASQGDFVGGSLWDMRGNGIRLNSPVAQQAQGPPLNPVEMALMIPLARYTACRSALIVPWQRASGACRRLLFNGREISIRCAVYPVPRHLPMSYRFISARRIAVLPIELSTRLRRQ
jgi:hypothetical protein